MFPFSFFKKCLLLYIIDETKNSFGLVRMFCDGKISYILIYKFLYFVITEMTHLLVLFCELCGSSIPGRRGWVQDFQDCLTHKIVHTSVDKCGPPFSGQLSMLHRMVPRTCGAAREAKPQSCVQTCLAFSCHIC